jgi:hypothetical protein
MRRKEKKSGLLRGILLCTLKPHWQGEDETNLEVSESAKKWT